MRCYFLQGLAAVGVLAGALFAIAIVVGIIWFCDTKVHYKIPQRVKTVSAWIFGVPFVALMCFAMAGILWELGGEVVHNLFHFCVGGGK